MSLEFPAILAIDDQPANLIALEAALKDCGYNLISACSGPEGLVRLHQHEFAAILLDVQMPIMDGFDCARIIRARGVDTPIIFLTAIHANESYAVRGYEAGAVDYLFKPLNADILRAKLAVFVDLFRKKKEIERQTSLLRESADRKYRDLVEGIRNGIVWTWPANNECLEYVSASAAGISGIANEVWLGEKNFILNNSHPDDREMVAQALAKLEETHEDVELEHRLVRPDHTLLWLHTTIRLANGSNGPEFRGLSVDITRLKVTEQSLRDMILIRDDFLSIASHELKTPLTPLQLQIEGFQRLSRRGDFRDVPTETLNRMLEVSAAQVDILARLVDQLLDVSRIKSGRLILQRAPTDLSQLVRKMIDVYHVAMERIPVEIDLPETLIGSWDGVRLEQIVGNLLGNAIKYGRKKPIKVQLKKLETTVELSVSDQGIGIPANAFDRIFHRFERAVSPNHYSGLGLGLFISQQIAQLHGGSIKVKSSVGAGSTFTLTLPLQSAHQ